MEKLTFTKQVDTELPAKQHVVALKNKLRIKGLDHISEWVKSYVVGSM